MKNLTLLFLFISTLSLCAQDSKLNWLTDFDEAKEVAKAENKPVLMYFTGSDWCGPCKKLKAEFFDSEKFKVEAKKMVLLMIDLPRRSGIITPELQRKNMLLMQRYNRRGSFPTLVGLNSEGKVIKDINGYNMNKDTNKHFQFLKEIVN